MSRQFDSQMGKKKINGYKLMMSELIMFTSRSLWLACQCDIASTAIWNIIASESV